MRPLPAALALLACAVATGYLLANRGHDGAVAPRAAAREVPRPAESLDVDGVLPAAPPCPPETAPVAPDEAPSPPPSPLGLPRPGALVAAVRLADGREPTDAIVAITREGARDRLEITPDAAGHVWLQGLSPGRYRLCATHPDYAPRSFAFDVPEGGGAGPFDIVLVEGGAVRVRVLGPGGVPLPDRPVRIRTLREVDLASPAVARTDAAGEARFDDLPGGYYWVSCGKSPGETGPARNVDVEPRRTTTVSFDLSCGLAGTLLDPSGLPVSRACIEFVPVQLHDAGCRLAAVVTGEDGRYELRETPPGEYLPRVDVRGPGGYVTTLEAIGLAEGERRRHDLRVPPGRLGGRVTCAVTGAPLSDGVTVQAMPVEVTDGEITSREGWHPGWLTLDGWSARHLARPDRLGRFAFCGLPAGKYEVWAVAVRGTVVVERKVVELSQASVLEGVDFPIARPAVGRVRLRVVGPGGAPDNGALFSERVRDGVSVGLNEAKIQVGDGVFDLSLPVGPHGIRAYTAAGTSGEFAIDVPEDRLLERVVSLEPRGR